MSMNVDGSLIKGVMHLDSRPAHLNPFLAVPII